MPSYNPTPNFRSYLYGPNYRAEKNKTPAVNENTVGSSGSVKPVKPLPKPVNDVSGANERIRKQTLIASDSLAPVVLGRDRFFAKLFIASVVDEILYAGFLVSHGYAHGIGGYNNVYIDGLNINDSEGFLSNSGADIHYHFGTQNQTADSFLSSAISGFNSAYEGFAYIVLKIPSGSTNGFPRVEVDVNGLKIPRYDSATPFEKTTTNSYARNLIKKSADISDSSHTNNGTTKTSTGNVGQFVECRVTGNGSVSVSRQTITGSNQYAVTLYYKFGTSAEVGVSCKDITSGNTSTVFGNVNSITATAISAGAVSILSNESLGSYRVLRFLFTPSVKNNSFGFDLLGSGSSTNVFFYGLQVETCDAVNDGTAEFTENPINIESFFIEQQLGQSINTDSAISAACWNNDVFPESIEPRRSFGLTLEKETKLTNIVENIRAYTGCNFKYESSGEINFVEYKERESSGSFGVNEIESIKINKKNSANIPTKVIVQYTDKNNDFKKAEAVAQDSNIANDWQLQNAPRISRINMIGFNDFSAAKREAIERYNYGALSDLSATITLFDKGVKVQVGEVYEITHPIGLNAKKMFVTYVEESTAGDWLVSLEEYQPELFSLTVESDPTFPDTNLPIHAAPPQIATVSLTEEVYQRRNGEYDNRIRVEWSQSTSPYTRGYVVRFKLGGDVIASLNETGLQTAYGPVEENVQYTVEVSATTSLYQGAIKSATIIPLGKYLIPSDVTNFSGFEVGGEVRLSWSAAVDLDIKVYEVRYGVAGVSWANAFVIDRVDALRLVTRDVPAGTWDFLIKARDSVSQYSVNEARTQIEVTLDERSLLVDSGVYPDVSTFDLLVHRTKEIREGSDVIYTDTSGETWSDLFSGSALPNANALASYQTVPSTNCRHRTGIVNIGYNVSGDWRIVLDWKVYAGAGEDYLAIADSTNYPTFTENSVNSVKAKAQYTYAEFRGIGLFRIDVGLQTFRVDAVTRKESGQENNASGGKIVLLENNYSAYKNITATPIFTGVPNSYYCVIDSVDLVSATNQFTVYMFDETGSEVTAAQPFLWSFEGV